MQKIVCIDCKIICQSILITKKKVWIEKKRVFRFISCTNTHWTSCSIYSRSFWRRRSWKEITHIVSRRLQLCSSRYGSLVYDISCAWIVWCYVGLMLSFNFSILFPNFFFSFLPLRSFFHLHFFFFTFSPLIFCCLFYIHAFVFRPCTVVSHAVSCTQTGSCCRSYSCASNCVRRENGHMTRNGMCCLAGNILM